MVATGNWSAQVLTEFLAGVAAADTEEIAIRQAVERAGEALESEIGALVREGRVETAMGFPPTRVPSEALVALAEEGGTTLEVDGLGQCAAVAVPLSGEPGGHLVLARSSGRQFVALEKNLIRAMGRVLNLSVEKLRTLTGERERRQLLGRLSRIQRSISHNTPLKELLDAITAGASELLGDELAGMVMVDARKPEEMVLMSVVGLADRELEEARPRRGRLGAAGRAVQQDKLIVIEDYLSEDDPHPFFVSIGLAAGMAAPVREGDEVVGALLVGSKSKGRRYGEPEREALLAFADHASLALTDARLSHQVERALHDPLTGLPNRAFVRERLEELLEDEARAAVLILGLDSFKEVNDRMGPGAGDDLLVAVAGRLSELAAPHQIIARLGGDEFAILPVPGEGGATLEALDEALGEPFELGGRVHGIRASIGIAPLEGGAGEVLRNADLAMHKAKDAGGRRCVVYESAMHMEVIERLELRDELARALNGDELEAHFQPKIDLASQEVVGFEALVRWRHPERGLLNPGEFLKVAEESNQMDELTRTMVGQSLRVAKAWWSAGRELQFSVNLSPSILHDPDSDLTELVKPLLDQFQLPGRALQLEVTEDALMRDDELAVQNLTRLGEHDVGLSIDDFGTGYSSLSRLKSLPIDELKIDRSFVMDLKGTGDDLAIVRSTIDLAHSMGLCVVAEGVETDAARRLLLGLGCERAQGFLIGRPMAPGQLGAWFEQWERGRRATVENSFASVDSGADPRSGRPGAIRRRLAALHGVAEAAQERRAVGPPG